MELYNAFFKDGMPNESLKKLISINNYIKDNNMGSIYVKTMTEILIEYSDLTLDEFNSLLPHIKYINTYKEDVDKLYNLYHGQEDWFVSFFGELRYYEIATRDEMIDASTQIDSLVEYTDEYRKFLKKIMVEDFIDIDLIRSVIPDPSLVLEDEKQVRSINYIYNSKMIPLSYRLTYLEAITEKVDNIKLVYDTPEGEKNAYFTLEEFNTKPKRAIKK